MSRRVIITAYQSGNSVKVETKDLDTSCGTGFYILGELISFSENMVAVRRDNYVYTYDANNCQTSARYSK